MKAGAVFDSYMSGYRGSPLYARQLYPPPPCSATVGAFAILPNRVRAGKSYMPAERTGKLDGMGLSNPCRRDRLPLHSWRGTDEGRP